jgi:hypothetical protein
MVSEGDCSPAALLAARPIDIVVDTACGQHNATKEVSMLLPSIGLQVPAMVLPNTLPAAAMGRLVIENCLDFHWLHSAPLEPWLVTKEGVKVTLDVAQYAPYLHGAGAAADKQSDATSCHSDSNAATITATSEGACVAKGGGVFGQTLERPQSETQADSSVSDRLQIAALQHNKGTMRLWNPRLEVEVAVAAAAQTAKVVLQSPQPRVAKGIAEHTASKHPTKGAGLAAPMPRTTSLHQAANKTKAEQENDMECRALVGNASDHLRRSQA